MASPTSVLLTSSRCFEAQIGTGWETPVDTMIAKAKALNEGFELIDCTSCSSLSHILTA